MQVKEATKVDDSVLEQLEIVGRRAAILFVPDDASSAEVLQQQAPGASGAKVYLVYYLLLSRLICKSR